MTTARSLLVIASLALAGVPGSRAQSGIPADSRIFVEEMADGLDQMIRAEILEKDVRVEIVTEQASAGYVLTGFGPAQRGRKWHQGWLTAKRKSASNSVSLVSREGEFIWAMEAPDHNRWLGALARDNYREVAERVAEGLRELAK
jgi:hypothetical protein